MTATTWGAVLGGVTAGGLLWVLARIRAIRRPQLAVRVLAYLRDLPIGTSPAVRRSDGDLVGPPLRWAAGVIERLLGGSASIQRRMDRLGATTTVHEFRIEQVQWGVAGFAVVAAFGLVRQLQGAGSPLASLLLACGGFGVGVICRDSRLTGQVARRERVMMAELPTVAELLALSVAAGEGPVPALDRVVARSRGELSRELARLLAEVRTGLPVQDAFDALAARTGLAPVARFANAIAIAVERGTPLAEVLHAQAADVREAGRRELIEVAARKEVAMMIPIVFLVLPTVVVFAMWPGFLGLSLSTA
ncbi:MAG: type II secretion system F family protein [Nocardioides sp.]|uniref:type II secretion system F family protein n=1 Tax=Nocardioides sp. TaxID=35761 RepID=UPI0039E564D6